MLVRRICPEEFAAEAFSGAGGLRHGARWHSKGVRIVYTSGSLSLAALEFFVNLDRGAAGGPLVAVSAEIPDSVKIRSVAPADLPSDWRAYPAPKSVQEIGSRWAERAESAVLAVPSVLIPVERNYLLNPVHRDFSRIVAGKPEAFTFDSRMWKPRA